MNKKKIAKIVAVGTISLLTLSGSVFAQNNTTSLQDNVVLDGEIDAGYTPDNSIGYQFDKFGDWVKLSFAKLGGDEKYDEVENEVLQERLAELKLVNEENREELQQEIKNQIQDRKERKEQKLQKLQEKINERKQELEQNNVTSVIDDEDLNDFEKEIKKIQNDIQTDDDDIRKKLKEVEQVRNEEIVELSKKLEQQEFEARKYNRQIEQFRKENTEMFDKYSSLIEDFDGKSFKITTDKREIVGEVIGDNVEFKTSKDIEDVDYKIEVKDEEELKEMIKNGDGNLEQFENNVDAPIGLKTKIAYNIAKISNE